MHNNLKINCGLKQVIYRWTGIVFLAWKSYFCHTNSCSLYFNPLFWTWAFITKNVKLKWMTKNAWSSENSPLDYKCIRNFWRNPHIKIVMHSYRLCGSYPRNYDHARDFQNNYWLISKRFALSSNVILEKVHVVIVGFSITSANIPPWGKPRRVFEVIKSLYQARIFLQKQ